MAKQIKVLAGSIGNLRTVIYTVPAGRVAKLVPAYLVASAASMEFWANGRMMLYGEAGSGFPVISQLNQGCVSIGAIIASRAAATWGVADGTTAGVCVVPGQIYLPAGNEVKVMNCHYDFLIVEEY